MPLAPFHLIVVTHDAHHVAQYWRVALGFIAANDSHHGISSFKKCADIIHRDYPGLSKLGKFQLADLLAIPKRINKANLIGLISRFTEDLHWAIGAINFGSASF